MSYFSWNCRGLGNSMAVHVLLGFVNKYKPDILFLCETLSNASKMEQVRIKLKYENCLTVEATRRGGGLALLWNGGLDVEVVGYSNHYIDTVVRQNGNRWRFTGFYGSPKRHQRHISWNILRYLSSLNDLPWVLMGDLNDILDAREKMGRVPHPQWLMRGFREAVRASGLFDFPFEGYQYTWDRGRGTENWVREKLDRILVSGNWMDLFTEARAWSIEGSSSNHMPLLLETNTIGNRHYRRRPRFENSWGHLPECKGVVENAWASLDGNPIAERLAACGRHVWEWGRQQSSKEGREIARCRERMGILRGAVDSEGVREAVFSMHPDKSPGPDGLSPAFFQLHWDILGDEVYLFCHNFLDSSQLPTLINETHIVLIPKTKHPELMSDFLLISLCNVFYRILAKVLANRFWGVLDSIISHAQSAFIPCRSIIDNVLIAFESTHALTRNKGSRGGYCALKVDMSKAFDRVEWGFLGQVLKKLGFGDRWIGWMKECVYTVRYNVLIDGRKWVFEARFLRDTLEEYRGASGQQVNFTKTSIIFGNNVHREDKEAVCKTLGVHEQQGRGRYLGLPGFVGRRKKEILGFIKEKVRARITHWGNRYLSQAGHEVLLKTVLQSIPNYAMNVFLLPKGISEDIERLMNSFWWGCEGKGGKGIRWSTWGALCKPKKYGGMGFRRVREMNLAMLGKQGWKFSTNPEALVTRVFKARYFPKCSFLEAGVGSNPSFVWSSIRESQGLLKEGARWRIGDGGTVRVWGDPWLPDSDNPYVVTEEQHYLHAPLVRSLFCVDRNKWDSDLLRDIFELRDVNLIQNLPLPNEPMPDVLYWGGEDNGLYSVKSAYRLAFGNLEQHYKLPWTAVACDLMCPLCGDEPETAIHLFADCSFAHSCWQEIQMGWPMESPGSIGLWVDEVWLELPSNMVEKVVTICWAIWENRNSMIWNNQCMDSRTMVRVVLAYVHDWKTAQPHQPTMMNALHTPSPVTAWRPPPLGCYKLNIDVALDFDAHSMGFGWLLRDAAGVVMGAAISMIKGIYFVKEAEAIGAREALSWIKKNGWSRVVLETDAQVVKNAVFTGQHCTPFGAIINDIRMQLKQLPLVNFVFAKCEANVPSHNLAKYALSNSGEGVLEFFDYIPLFISSSVLDDYFGLY
ncbi:PREDICTED: uncharacterized protein LOC109156647 [Ipomoea nil]|uniref:uncharacterized protein LOC109156647 n=1 Tax=Ipomoea nil TaxID=35883 RepID=UPI000901B11E|nr:PREDICTED: uncharacterized protein LOC109156647 [Ipomoea nil]